MSNNGHPSIKGILKHRPQLGTEFEVDHNPSSEPVAAGAGAPGARASASRVPLQHRRWGFLPSAAVLLPLLVSLAYLSTRVHYTLPTPNPSLFAADGKTPLFSETRGMDIIRALATHPDGEPRYRIVGTEEMVETERWVLDEVHRIRDDVVARMQGHPVQIETWHQLSWEHLFDFMDKKVWKKYFDIGNVIVRLSDGTAASKKNAVLVNAHTDSTLPSPGAADDLIGVAAMLEALRVMALTPRRLSNSVIFRQCSIFGSCARGAERLMRWWCVRAVFNGGEESLQDASHLFITQHPLKDSVRAVINLEACGVGGPEIVFQATSEEMIKALSKTPRPYGTTLASEIFQTGLILSDTDFRQFVEYGNLTGLDMALVQNSYLYHTRLDVPELIEPGALQHMGENTLALLEYLTSNETALGNSLTAKKLPKMKSAADTIFFSSMGGKIFIMYSRAQGALLERRSILCSSITDSYILCPYLATAIYASLATLAFIVVSDRLVRQRKRLYLLTTAGVGLSLLAAILGSNLAAAATSIVMGKTMTWLVKASGNLRSRSRCPNEAPSIRRFSNESFAVYLFGPPAALAVCLLQRSIAKRVRTHGASPALEAHESSLLEHATLMGQLIYSTVILCLGHALGVGSSYLYAVAMVSNLTALVVNDYVLTSGPEREVHLATYFFQQVLGLVLGVEGLVSFLDIFVPLTGRLGADAPVDFIIASLTAAVGFLALPVASPASNAAVVLTFITAASLGWFTRPASSPYDRLHPKRLLVLHMENTTTTPPRFDLHVASVDGAPFQDLLVEATKGLTASNKVPEALRAHDHSTDWDIIFPVSQFLTTYKVPLPPTEASYVSPFAETFTVKAIRSSLNSISRTRSLEIEMLHPGLIWPVIAFDADVVSWDLPEPPARGVIRHHVKSVAGYGVTRFVLSLVVYLDEETFGAVMREQQRAKGQRGDASRSDAVKARLRIDYSALDSKGMYPSSIRHAGLKEKPGMRFFETFEQQLPEYVDAMLLSAVAGVAYV
ncbi:BZ3500_MvSof-1268-A1-R1_Chr1-3g01827 [Microbotryum saponariae]|uniref:Peptide hydrolase n=1 Tax=Microbotryum saponariae TaxID=289078 RepID=A0A2X0MQG7_9BASI|nr:BZ3500_MvSof-1268-A1-R1_Chr1-3g01827 [Microbotryum saponariae]SCZ94684.1 BZ3501_MvSof-1269-A2-R1_Chr1-3g01429 [Microbotryum saponariae]